MESDELTASNPRLPSTIVRRTDAGPLWIGPPVVVELLRPTRGLSDLVLAHGEHRRAPATLCGFRAGSFSAMEVDYVRLMPPSLDALSVEFSTEATTASQAPRDRSRKATEYDSDAL
jgi:hypothetical protein